MADDCNEAMKYNKNALFRQEMSIAFSDIGAKWEMRVSVLLIISQLKKGLCGERPLQNYIYMVGN